MIFSSFYVSQITQWLTNRYTKTRPYSSLSRRVMSEITVYGADWCTPCKFLKENVRQWAEEVKCDIEIKFVEYDSELHCIKKLPTMVYTYDGLEKQRIEGTNKTEVKIWLMNAQAYQQFFMYGYGD